MCSIVAVVPRHEAVCAVMKALRCVKASYLPTTRLVNPAKCSRLAFTRIIHTWFSKKRRLPFLVVPYYNRAWEVLINRRKQINNGRKPSLKRCVGYALGAKLKAIHFLILHPKTLFDPDPTSLNTHSTTFLGELPRRRSSALKI